ncbi:MAG: hypothetical protein LCH32_07750 [Bacteroidetes bacterium]|nr:hypothetical protein [Bacteroidota bacterium]
MFFIAITLFFGISSYSSQTIIWQENKPLKWSDFKGKPEKRFAVASTSYVIDMVTFEITQNQFKVSTNAIFYCKDSWKNNKWISDAILKHEQLHFDIAELFSRKMREKVTQIVVKNYDDLKQQTDKIYYQLEKEMDVYQNLYDDETENSMNKLKQQEWESKVKNDLNNLSNFKTKDIIVHVN